MGFRRGVSRPGGGRDVENGERQDGGGGGSYSASGARERKESNGSPDDCPSLPSVVHSTPKSRRRRPWLRVIFALFVIVEAVVLFVVHEFSPVHHFEITSVTVTGEDGVTTVVGNNPDLLYPVILGGSSCRVSDMAGCVVEGASAATLSTVCCTELLDPDSTGPEELISTLADFLYAVVIPGVLLIVRGFLLGRLWTLRVSRNPPYFTRGEHSEAAWGKRRWHLRVGFFALDAFLGLYAAVVTASLFSTVAKVTVGRPRPNYYALLFYTEHAANGRDFDHFSITSWPSADAATSMSGLLFLAYVLWRDLAALVMWRRRAHPSLSLVLAVLGGFALGALPMSAVLIGVTRIREYWHRPDDILVGLVIGAAAAHWSFRFVVLMPFDYEIGSPEWQEDPKWLEDEEKQRQEEEEALRLCGWRRRSWKERGRRPQIALSPSSDIEKAQDVLPPAQVVEIEEPTGKQASPPF